MKQINKIGFYAAFILPILLVVGFHLGGLFIFSIHIFVFIFVPALDYFVRKDQRNVPTAEIPLRSKESFYKLVLFNWVYIQYAVLLWGLFVGARYNLSVLEWIGLATGLALITGGVGITVAHELGHKKSWLERFYAKALLLSVCYMHFTIEHNKGHHKRVATPHDPATSRKGESFYRFWIRSVFGSFKSAWELELARLQKFNLSKWSAKNQMLQFMILPLVFVSLCFIVLSLLTGVLQYQVILLFFVQSVLAFSLLELVNYIEHYGMLRKELAPGRYEKVTPLHSWNASHTVSNFLLFQLQRHSDHHAYAYKPYQVLEHHDVSPQLPQGYSAMIILALFPPLWFRIMDEKLLKWQVEREIF